MALRIDTRRVVATALQPPHRVSGSGRPGGDDGAGVRSEGV